MMTDDVKLTVDRHEHEQAIRRAYIHGTRAGKVIPADDEARETIWHQINEARHQITDAIMSRMTEILWPNGITTHTSCAHQRPLRFYPDLVEVEVQPIDGKGRGVVALWPIKEGTVVETAPVTPFDHSQNLPKELEDLPAAWTDDQDCIVMGVAQFVNHSDNPNCVLERNHANLTVSLIATRLIPVGEELTYKYKTVWFEVKP